MANGFLNSKLEQYGATAATTTVNGAVTASTAVTIASGTGTANGQYVNCTGVPAGTTIASGGGTTSIVLSVAATIADKAAITFTATNNVSVPKPGNETTTPAYGLERFFPVQMTKPSLGADPMERDDELRNYDQPLLEITDTYDPTWELTQRAYPDTIGWHLANILGRDSNNGYTTTSGGNDLGGTALSGSARTHTWTAPFGPSGALPQTQRLGWAYTDQSTFYTLLGAATEGLEIDTPDKGGVTAKASGPGLYLTSGSASTAITSTSPSYESPSIRPFVHANLQVSFSGTNAPSSPGAASGFTVTINNPVTAIRTLGVASQFPDRMEKDDGLLTFSGTISKRNLTKTEWDAMRDLNLFTITATWTGGYISGSSGPKYGLQIVSQAQLVGGDVDDLDNKRRHGSTFNWKSVYDGSTASTVVNLVNATATYAA